MLIKIIKRCWVVLCFTSFFAVTPAYAGNVLITVLEKGTADPVANANIVLMGSEDYVITDEKCETSIPGIFAIGDLRQKYANQIVLAAADGCTAALAAAHYVETRKGK